MKIIFRPAVATWFYSCPGMRPFLFEVNEEQGEVVKVYRDGSRELAGNTPNGIKHVAQLAGWRRVE